MSHMTFSVIRSRVVGALKNFIGDLSGGEVCVKQFVPYSSEKESALLERLEILSKQVYLALFLVAIFLCVILFLVYTLLKRVNAINKEQKKINSELMIQLNTFAKMLIKFEELSEQLNDNNNNPNKLEVKLEEPVSKESQPKVAYPIKEKATSNEATLVPVGEIGQISDAVLGKMEFEKSAINLMVQHDAIKEEEEQQQSGEEEDDDLVKLSVPSLSDGFMAGDSDEEVAILKQSHH